MTTKVATDVLGQRVFTSEEVKARYALSDHAAWQAVLYAKRRGQIGAVRKGLYFVIPPGADPVTCRPDPYLVAAKAEPSGALAYHGALDLHGVAYSAFHELAVAAPKWRRGFPVGDVRVRFVVSPTTFGVETLSREGVPVRVTDRERTVVDCCDRPAYAGGLDALLRSVEGFPSVDHERVLDYVRRYGRKSLAAKVGWVLSAMRIGGASPKTSGGAFRGPGGPSSSSRPRGSDWTASGGSWSRRPSSPVSRRHRSLWRSTRSSSGAR